MLHWRYIVTFTKVLTLYHCWIHPSIILLIPGIVSTGLIFSIFIHEYIVFPQYSPFYTIFWPLQPILPLLFPSNPYFNFWNSLAFRCYHCSTKNFVSFYFKNLFFLFLTRFNAKILFTKTIHMIFVTTSEF
jgi:hypothetical protein